MGILEFDLVPPEIGLRFEVTASYPARATAVKDTLVIDPVDVLNVVRPA